MRVGCTTADYSRIYQRRHLLQDRRDLSRPSTYQQRPFNIVFRDAYIPELGASRLHSFRGGVALDHAIYPQRHSSKDCHIRKAPGSGFRLLLDLYICGVFKIYSAWITRPARENGWVIGHTGGKMSTGEASWDAQHICISGSLGDRIYRYRTARSISQGLPKVSGGLRAHVRWFGWECRSRNSRADQERELGERISHIRIETAYRGLAAAVSCIYTGWRWGWHQLGWADAQAMLYTRRRHSRHAGSEESPWR